ncbi:hypothetical protein EMIT0158MI4_120170 [Burkholderia ambifaria]
MPVTTITCSVPLVALTACANAVGQVGRQWCRFLLFGFARGYECASYQCAASIADT